jgi:hypothetical protein
MEPTTFAEVAGMLARFGMIGVAVAAVNGFALHVVRTEEVPRWAQGRIRWWSAHNRAFLFGSTALTLISLGALAIS